MQELHKSASRGPQICTGNSACLQVRTWADEQALQRVLVPVERALPAVQQPRRASVRASFMAASADALGLGDRGSLDRRVAQAVAACGACAARIKDLEAAVKLCVAYHLQPCWTVVLH